MMCARAPKKNQCRTGFSPFKRADGLKPILHYGGSTVPIFVHAPQRAMRHTVFAPPTIRPCLRIDSCPYHEHVGVKRQVIVPRRCGEMWARYWSMA